MTLREALVDAEVRLQRAGVDTPLLDAQLLLAYALGESRTFVRAHLPDPLAAEPARAFEDALRRREAREPLPYILGTWEFFGMRFRVGPGVLIPRPETELLVEAVASRLEDQGDILDVGAGSGCISVGLASLLPRATVTGLEASPEAAVLARENVQALGFAGRVRIVEGWFPAAAEGMMGPFDAVVSNPPYIRSREVDELAPELLRFEPRLALDGGADGLEVVRPLVRESPGLLRPRGWLAVEVAAGQAPEVARLIAEAGCWEPAEGLRDLAGIERVVITRLLP